MFIMWTTDDRCRLQESAIHSHEPVLSQSARHTHAAAVAHCTQYDSPGQPTVQRPPRLPSSANSSASATRPGGP